MDDRATELRAKLADLHHQLKATSKVDPELRSLLVEVLADIAAVLDDQGHDEALPAAQAVAIEPQNLTDRLADAARQFEDTHPNLSATIGSVITALSRTGI